MSIPPSLAGASKKLQKKTPARKQAVLREELKERNMV
jgi:hypothetical protein